MKYFSVLCIFLIFALAACYAAVAEPNQVADADPADASLAEKKTEKRGIYGFGYGHSGYGAGYGGYGGYYGHGVGYPHYGGYAAVHHGFAAAPYYGGHAGYYPHYHHGLYH